MGSADTPFDRDDFDPGLVALVTLLRGKPAAEPSDDPDDIEEAAEERARIELLEAGMPASIRALLHARANHGGGVDLTAGHYGFESYSIETLHFHDSKDEIAEAFSAHGVAAGNVMQWGDSGGGEETLMLAWTADGYFVVPYSVGNYLAKISPGGTDAGKDVPEVKEARKNVKARIKKLLDIGGNKFRLVVTARLDFGRLYIRRVMTHAEYDQGKWKEDC